MRLTIYLFGIYKATRFFSFFVACLMLFPLSLHAGGPQKMILNLSSEWRQWSPYNDQCPVLTPPDEHTRTGCPATAMSQIMYYWKWPNRGEGKSDKNYYEWWYMSSSRAVTALANDPGITSNYMNNRLTWDPANGGMLEMSGYWDMSLYNDAKGVSEDTQYRNALDALWSALTKGTTQVFEVDFGATTYNWNILKDRHHPQTSPPYSGDSELAKVCYHVGMAINTEYGVAASGRKIEYVEQGLKNHFRYDQDALCEEKDDSTIGKLIEEIQWLRPVHFRGSINNRGGHHWVIYGYDKSNGKFLMNLGDGRHHIWYSLDDATGLQYTTLQKHITRIAPINVKFVGNSQSGDGSPSDPYRDIEEAIQKAPEGGTLIFKAGSVNRFSTNTFTINKHLTLKGEETILCSE